MTRDLSVCLYRVVKVYTCMGEVSVGPSVVESVGAFQYVCGFPLLSPNSPTTLINLRTFCLVRTSPVGYLQAAATTTPTPILTETVWTKGGGDRERTNHPPVRRSYRDPRHGRKSGTKDRLRSDHESCLAEGRSGINLVRSQVLESNPSNPPSLSSHG